MIKTNEERKMGGTGTMGKGTVVVIDDEKDLIELVRYNLEKEGFDVIGAMNGEAGLEIARQHRPNLILLDLMLPGMDGLEVCRRIRNDNSTVRIPIIILTAKADEPDRIVGLELGADDYITKPFSPRELAARVKAVLRRAGDHHEPAEVIRRGDLLVDVARHEVSVKGAKIALTATEFRILQFLAGRPGRVYSRNEIMDAAIGHDSAVLDRTIDVHVAAIRKKLGKCGELIETLRGVGYKFQWES
jgi:two-component system phosphate regulon response regulator PhoB